MILNSTNKRQKWVRNSQLTSVHSLRFKPSVKMFSSSNRLHETILLMWSLKWKEKMPTWLESMKKNFKTWKMSNLRTKFFNLKSQNLKISTRPNPRKTKSWTILLKILLLRLTNTKALMLRSKTGFKTW